MSKPKSSIQITAHGYVRAPKAEDEPSGVGRIGKIFAAASMAFIATLIVATVILGLMSVVKILADFVGII